MRKYSGEDYITHLGAVASIVEAVEHTTGMLAAAWLQSVLETGHLRLLLTGRVRNLSAPTPSGATTLYTRLGF